MLSDVLDSSFLTELGDRTAAELAASA